MVSARLKAFDLYGTAELDQAPPDPVEPVQHGNIAEEQKATAFVVDDVAKEYAAYDRLPPDLRAYLREHTDSISALQLTILLRARAIRRDNLP